MILTDQKTNTLEFGAKPPLRVELDVPFVKPSLFTPKCLLPKLIMCCPF